MMMARYPHCEHDLAGELRVSGVCGLEIGHLSKNDVFGEACEEPLDGHSLALVVFRSKEDQCQLVS
jgi:hypothetical protein